MLYVLLAINNILNRVILWLATIIVALMVLALSLSALTRYVSGIGYDWFIELPPVLTSWLVFPLLGPLLVQGKHIKVDFLTSILSDKSKVILRMFVATIALMADIEIPSMIMVETLDAMHAKTEHNFFIIFPTSENFSYATPNDASKNDFTALVASTNKSCSS